MLTVAVENEARALGFKVLNLDLRETQKAAIDEATPAERGRLVIELAELRAAVRAEKISEVAAEFDGVHNIHRAVEVGSVDEVIAASDLRPKVVAAIEKGLPA